MRGPNDRMNQIIQFMCFGSMIEEHFYHHVWGPFECPHRHCEYICLFICHSYWYFMCMFPSPSLSLSLGFFQQPHRINNDRYKLYFRNTTQSKANKSKLCMKQRRTIGSTIATFNEKQRKWFFHVCLSLLGLSLSLSICVSILLSFDAQFCLPFFVCVCVFYLCLSLFDWKIVESRGLSMFLFLLQN